MQTGREPIDKAFAQLVGAISTRAWRRCAPVQVAKDVRVRVSARSFGMAVARLEVDAEADAATRDHQPDGWREKGERARREREREIGGRASTAGFPKMCARGSSAGCVCDGLTGTPRSRIACPPSQKSRRLSFARTLRTQSAGWQPAPRENLLRADRTGKSNEVGISCGREG